MWQCIVALLLGVATLRTEGVVLKGVDISPPGQKSVITSVVPDARGVAHAANFSAGSIVQLNLGIPSEQFSLLKHADEVCLQVDSEICECYGGGLFSSTIVLSSRCAMDASWTQFYLSAVLRSNQSVLAASTPLLLLNSAQPDLASRIRQSHLLTLLLPVTLNDIGRAAILLESLAKIPPNVVLELQVYCPDRQQRLLYQLLKDLAAALAFPTVITAESSLFLLSSRGKWNADPYALQMAIKLVASRSVRSLYYLTLDADVVLLRGFALDRIFRGPKAVYRWESTTVHDSWWRGSSQLLGVEVSSAAGFGVTPAVLSTWGSRLALSTLRQRLCRDASPTDPCIHWQERWVKALAAGGVWTEYTLYRLVLDHFRVFEDLHVEEAAAGSFLSCEEVWYSGDWPWDVGKAMRNDSCLFSLVQSTAAIPPAAVHSALLHAAGERYRTETESSEVAVLES